MNFNGVQSRSLARIYMEEIVLLTQEHLLEVEYLSLDFLRSYPEVWPIERQTFDTIIDSAKTQSRALRTSRSMMRCPLYLFFVSCFVFSSA